MAENKFFELFNDIDDKYIKEAEQTASGPDMYIEYVPGKISKRTVILSAAGALAACAALVFGIVKLPGLIHGLSVSGDSMSVSSAVSGGEVSNSLLGTPIPENELEDFNYDELADSYRETFPEELKAVLDEIGKPEVAEAYCRARTLADLQSHILNVDVVATDAAKAKMEKQMRACLAFTLRTMDTAYPDDKYEYYETGYRYDSFIQAFRDVFCENSAENLIMLSRYGFTDSGGQLYATDGYSLYGTEVYGLVHTDYEIITNTDDEVVFNTVHYSDYVDEFVDVREPYDPANRDTYLNREGKRFVMTYTNRLVKIDGVWKAENICYDTIFQTLKHTFENCRAEITEKLMLEGEPFPESSYKDFEYGETLSEYTEELKKDENLMWLLEQIGDDEFTEQYYKARTLAEVVAISNEVYFNVKNIGAILSFRDNYNQECDRYLELGYKYDSFLETLNETFGDATVDYMLSHGTWYNYNNSLCSGCRSFEVNPLLVRSEYELKTHTDSEIVFDTICYHIRPEDYDPFSDRRYKDEPDFGSPEGYTITRITNRFVKVNGKWIAEELCFLGDLSSVGNIQNDSSISLQVEHYPLKLTGTPLSESELVDFDYEKALNSYRGKLSEDEGLTAILESIGKPELTDAYYRARTLADMTARVMGVPFYVLDKAATSPDRASIEFLTEVSSTRYIFTETGYRYDSFADTLREVFGNEGAEVLLKRYCHSMGMIYDYNGELYICTMGYPESMYHVHTEYELIKNTDSEVVFNSICYHLPDDYYDDRFTDWTTPEYDPAKKDEYYTTKIVNRFVKSDGKWTAQEICMAGNHSSAWDTNSGNVLTDDIGNSFVLSGTPLSESEFVDFNYDGWVETFRADTDKNEELSELLNGLGKPEVVELYYKAGALAELVGYADADVGLRRHAIITMTEDTPPMPYSCITTSYKRWQTFRETGVRYDSFIKALDEVFCEGSRAMLLACYPYFYNYNGELYCSEISPYISSDLVYTEYILEENSGDTVRFTTVNYYAPADRDLTYNVDDPDVHDPDSGFIKVCVNNEFRYVDGEWKTYEICMLAECTSRGGKTYVG